MLSDAFGRMTRAEAVTALDAADVPNGPVLALNEVLADRHVQARGCVGRFDHPALGEFPALALPFKLEGWDGPEVGTPPELGADTDAVLRDLLGYDAARVARLREEDAI